MKIKLAFLSIIYILLLKCDYPNQDSKNVIVKNPNNEAIIKYAKKLKIEDYKKYKKVTITNPSQLNKLGKITFFLINKNESIPKHLKDKNVIKTPVQNIICMSTTHIGMLEELNSLDCLTAISDKNYIYTSKINKDIPEVGHGKNINTEKIINLNPELILGYTIDLTLDKQYRRFNELGIKTIYIAEYLENHPLAKAEWIKLFGYMTGKDSIADSIFKNIENEYNNLIMNINDSLRPSILTSSPWNNVWYISGGNTYLAQLIFDAGGKYIWKEDTFKNVYAYDIEKVYNDAGNSDIWINPGSYNKKQEIKNIDEKLTLFNAYRTNKIYNNNKRIRNTGNDYYESGVIHPERILKDLIHIFHPDSIPEHEFIYYKKI